MNMKPEKLAAKLAKYTEYRKLFREVYQSDPITFDKIAKALATFQRTIRSQPSKLDKFMKEIIKHCRIKRFTECMCSGPKPDV